MKLSKENGLRKALFLDINATINITVNSKNDLSDVEFIEGALELCAYFQENDYIVIALINPIHFNSVNLDAQNCRGLDSYIVSKLKRNHINVEKTYKYIYNYQISEIIHNEYTMLAVTRLAAKNNNLNLSKCIVISNNQNCINILRNEGLGCGIFVVSELGKQAVFHVLEG